MAERFGRAVPYLCVRGGAAALDFHRSGFGATETVRLTDDGGRIGHSEFLIGDNRFMLSDEWPEMKVLSPLTAGGHGVLLHPGRRRRRGGPPPRRGRRHGGAGRSRRTA